MGKDFKPASGRVTLTSPIGRGAIYNIECADSGHLAVNGDTPPCKIGFYTVDVGGTIYNTFVGKTETENNLTDSECRGIMSLPIIDFEEYGSGSAAWLRSSTGGAKPNELDRLVSAEDFIQKQLESRTSVQNEEIARMREANNRKKRI